MQRLNAQTVQPEFVSLTNAGIVIDKSRSYVQKMDRLGRFVPKYRINNSSFFKLSDIRSWMEKHLEKA